MEVVMDRAHNFRSYREKLSKALKSNHPVIPALALHLRDITFVLDGNPSKIEGSINFEKLEMLGSSLQIFSKLLPYSSIKVDFTLQNFFIQLRCESEEHLYQSAKNIVITENDN